MKEITVDFIKKVKQEYKQNPINKIIENAIVNNGINKSSFNHEVITENQNVFNIELPESKRYDQKNSGRCWAYAGINMLKHNLAKNLNIKVEDIELSINYITFFDKLEKSNTIYEHVIELEKIDFDTINEEKFIDLSEGGYFEYFKELVKKYGIIPSSYMKENTPSLNSSELLNVFDEKIKRDVYTLLNDKKLGKTKEELEEVTKKMIKENYKILANILGAPPISILLEYKDKEDKIIRQELTPQEFFKKYCTLNLDDYVTVGSMKMYNKEFYQKYKRKYNENIFQKGIVEFINLPQEELKSLIVKQLKDEIPVWFAAEVKKMFHTETGILDMNNYSYEQLFHFKQLTQEENLNLHMIKVAHAMSFVGVHIIDETIIRWKVENSWGDKNNNGYLIMNDNFFSNFVLSATINKKYLTEKQVKVLNQEAIILSPDDPY